MPEPQNPNTIPLKDAAEYFETPQGFWDARSGEITIEEAKDLIVAQGGKRKAVRIAIKNQVIQTRKIGKKLRLVNVASLRRWHEVIQHPLMFIPPVYRTIDCMFRLSIHPIVSHVNVCFKKIVHVFKPRADQLITTKRGRVDISIIFRRA